MFLAKVDRVQHAQNFIDIASEIQVINSSVFQHSSLIDNKQPSQGNAGILDKNVIVGCDLLVQVGKQRKTYSLDAAVFAIDLRPRRMSEFRIDRGADDLRLTFFKIFDPI